MHMANVINPPSDGLDYLAMVHLFPDERYIVAVGDIIISTTNMEAATTLYKNITGSKIIYVPEEA